jgi:AraC family transcriptional activator of pyochelin receptor
MQVKARLDVSFRMQVYMGPGAVPEGDMPADAIRILFHLGRNGQATLAIGDPVAESSSDMVFVVDRAGCQEVVGMVPEVTGVWHLPSDQRAMVMAIMQCSLPEPASRTLRTVKAVELLCVLTTDLASGRLVRADGAGELCELDTQRIISARRMIDERWHEKLTVDGIARACGVNRAKLTRGFRLIFGCTIADAIAEKRLSGARNMLFATDLPIAAIGYRCGYLNNAAFTRAFSRRFGLAPTSLRAGGVLAA